MVSVKTGVMSPDRLSLNPTPCHCLASYLCPLKYIMPSEGNALFPHVTHRYVTGEKQEVNLTEIMEYKVFRQSLYFLWGAVTKILNCCMDALVFVRPKMSPFLAGKVHSYSCTLSDKASGSMMSCEEPRRESEAVPTVLGKRPTQDWQAGHEDGLRERDISEWLEWDSEEELEAERDLKGEDPGCITGSCLGGILETVPKSSFSSPGECWVSHRILSRVSSLSPSEGAAEVKDDVEWSDEEEEEDEDEENWEDESGMSDEMSEATAELWESFLRSDDPYNPFAFLGPCGKEKKRKSEEGEETGEAEPPGSWKGEDDGLKKGQQGKDCCRLQEGKNEGKKVRFSDTVVVRPLVVWAFASRGARSGACWQEMARDRDRFQRRVQQTSVAIEPCLQPEHRAQVWERLHALSSGL